VPLPHGSASCFSSIINTCSLSLVHQYTFIIRLRRPMKVNRLEVNRFLGTSIQKYRVLRNLKCRSKIKKSFKKLNEWVVVLALAHLVLEEELLLV